MAQRFVDRVVPERFVEVDAARLLLILTRFATPIDDRIRELQCFPGPEVTRHFTPEYYLQKLDFLVRYPGYLAYELIELCGMGTPPASDPTEIASLVRQVLLDREPELLTQPFRKFWRGAFERLDDVEAWWHARRLVFRGLELRGASRPQKHYFLTPLADDVAGRLAETVDHARWYADRADLIHRFFGGMSAADVKALQYSHAPYRQAQLNEAIPDVRASDIEQNFIRVFREPIGVVLE